MSFPIYIEYYPLHFSHGHQLVIETTSDRQVLREIVGNSEEYAEELAEAVRICSPDRHDGHGEDHSTEDTKNAFQAGVTQLLTIDYAAEWSEVQRQMRRFKKWGGHAPEAVIFPDQDENWQLMVTDSEGNPYIHGLRKEAVEEVLAPPSSLGLARDSNGIGWQTKRRWPAQRRLRYLHKKGK